MARKTHTSTEVKRRYNEKVYSNISLAVPKDIAEQFREKCKSLEVSQRQVLLQAIENFLKEK